MARKETKEVVDAAQGIDAESKKELEAEMNREDAASPALDAVPAHRAGPVEITHDELGMADPTLDVSPFIEYYFYKCRDCGHRVMAGAGEVQHFERSRGTSVEIDTKMEVECPQCTLKGPGGEVLLDKSRKIPGTNERRPMHGTMVLHHFKVKRKPA